MPDSTPAVRNTLTRALARKAEDALLALSREPSFPTLSRLAIAESLTATLGFPIVPSNLKKLAEAIEITLPSTRTSSSDSLSDIRLTRVEDAISFLLRNAGRPITADDLRQLEVVRSSWLSHLSAHRTKD
jgi:hypothetical protein